MCDVAFENFLASVDPARVERERFGKPGPNERPGSPEDEFMLMRHGIRVREFWQRYVSAQQTYEADLAIASYARRKKHQKKQRERK